MSCQSLLVLALLLASCNDSGAQPSVAPPSGWTIAYSPSMPPRASGDVFDFPPAAGGAGHSDGVHYVFKAAPSVSIDQIITLRFLLKGNGKLVATEGNIPARVRLFMQRQGDTLTAAEPYKRWWSRAYVDLVSPGEFVLTARVVPEEWISVFGEGGEVQPDAFAECVSTLAHIGFTFGGQFAGHGVTAVDGAVRFVLKDFIKR